MIERWELLQAQRFGQEADAQRDLQQWQKLNSDLSDVTSWLGRVLPELERLQSFTPATSIRDFKANIRQLKVWSQPSPALFCLLTLTSVQEMQKSFTSYKCLMISINLSSRSLLRGGGAEQAGLQDALGSANHSWTQACGSLERWERRLHAAVLQCQVRRRLWPPPGTRGRRRDDSSRLLLQDFHQTLHSLLLWLAQADSRLAAAGAARPPAGQRRALTVRTPGSPGVTRGGASVAERVCVCGPLVAGAAGGAAGAAAAGELAAGGLGPAAAGRRRRRRPGGQGEGPRHRHQAAAAAAPGPSPAVGAPGSGLRPIAGCRQLHGSRSSGVPGGSQRPAPPPLPLLAGAVPPPAAAGDA